MYARLSPQPFDSVFQPSLRVSGSFKTVLLCAITSISFVYATPVTDTAVLGFATLATKACATPAPAYTLLLPATQGVQNQVLALQDNAGTLGWQTIQLYGDVTGTATANTIQFVCGISSCAVIEQYQLLASATSADIPLTLVLRDTTGSFSSSTITLTGCLLLTDSLGNTAGTLCGKPHSVVVTAYATRALIAPSSSAVTADGITPNVAGTTPGQLAVDLQLTRSAASMVATGTASTLLAGYSNTASGAESAVVAGAQSTVAGNSSAIIAGFLHTATGYYSAAIAGSSNTVASDYSVINGGLYNSITSSPYSTIMAGSGNTTIGVNSLPNAIIAGTGNSAYGYINNLRGAFNTIGTATTSQASYSAILSGSGNSIQNFNLLVIAGGANSIAGQSADGSNPSFIGAGGSNQLGTLTQSGSNGYSGIVAGLSNVINLRAVYSIIFGGQGNTGNRSSWSTFGAGQFNTMGPNLSQCAIFAGSSNALVVSFAVIGGGIGNKVSNGMTSCLGAGQYNNTTSSGYYSGIVTGSGNTITSTYAIIFGGQNNSAGYTNIVGGGLNNAANIDNGILAGSSNAMLSSGSPFSVIGGGIHNQATSSSSTTFANCICAGQYNTTNGQYSGIVTGSGNTVPSGSSLSIILSGQNNSASGQSCIVGSGVNNSNVDRYSGLLTGMGNTVASSSASLPCVSGGGIGNSINNTYALVGAGKYNNILNVGNGSSAIVTGSGNSVAGFGTVILSGQNNAIGSNGSSGISSGINNGITTSGASESFIGGGLFNTLTTAGLSSIVSGSGNTSSSNFATISGGAGNTVSATDSMVLGGQNNTASGYYSCAAGTNASTSAAGSFIWSDTSSTLFSTAISNSFYVRASNGFRFATNPAGTVGAVLFSGAGAWSSLSDGAYKTNIQPLDTLDTINTLTTLATVTTATWSLISQDPSITHIGPMAQDLYTAFGYGEDLRYINVSDALGIVSASVQGLYALYQDLLTDNLGLNKHIHDYYERMYMAQLEQRVKVLEDRFIQRYLAK